MAPTPPYKYPHLPSTTHHQTLTKSMARKKVKLEYIANDASRRATFKKRRKGLIKKVSELSTLCDVKACLVVYGHDEPVPEVWPSGAEAVRVVARLKRMPEMEQSKKMMDQEGFMRQRIAKLQEQVRKLERENREMEISLSMNERMLGGGGGLEAIGVEEVTGLAWLVEVKVGEVRRRIEAMSKAAKAAPVAVKVEEQAVAAAEKLKEKSAMEVAMEELQRQEWFTEIMNGGGGGGVGGGGGGGGEMGGVGGFGGYMDHGVCTNASTSGNPWIMDSFFPLN